MALTLYMRKSSPPCRAVLMTAKFLGINMEHIQMNKDDHSKPEFLKLNPQHTVPTLVDNDKVIWDSHAINVYLVEKYGKEDSLYPKDHHKRAIINQRLHFDTGVVFATSRIIRNQMVLKGIKIVSPEQLETVNELYGFLEKFLEGHQWAVGDNVTLADLTLIPSVTTFNTMVPIEAGKFPNIMSWIKRAQSWPCYNINEEGLADFRKMIKK